MFCAIISHLKLWYQFAQFINEPYLIFIIYPGIHPDTHTDIHPDIYPDIHPDIHPDILFHFIK